MRQLSLFDSDLIDTTWTSDDWQTPNDIAIAMSKLVKSSEHNILEPCAGIGQIAKFLPSNRNVVCLEIDAGRIQRGIINAPSCSWIQADFFEISEKFDLIIGNPPFSLCVEFISRSLSLLNSLNSEARILFLLPLDWNCPQSRREAWEKLDARIHHEYRCKGRVSYLDGNNIPQKRRRVCDGVFDIRLGRCNAAVSYL